MKNIIKTELCPKAIGPYSQAIVVDGFLITSGQIGINPENGEISQGDIKTQTLQALENIKNLITASGYSINDVVKSTIFLTDMGSFSLVNELYGKYFTETIPARSCVQVAALPKGALIEIEVIAHK